MELKFAADPPTPEEASFVLNHPTWKEVDCHCKHGPPVVFTITVLCSITKPPRTCSKVRRKQPPNEENGVVDGSQSQVSFEKEYEEVLKE